MAPAKQHIENPYQDVDWKQCEYIHSMSHQHGGQWTPSSYSSSIHKYYEMGFRHLAVSNYYPSQPVYPLPEDFLESHPDAIGAPNAEHHSFTDFSMHVCAVGSHYRTGYGQSADQSITSRSPAVVTFKDLNPYSDQKPWIGVYRLDIDIGSKTESPESAEAWLTIEGASRCDRRSFEILNSGQVKELELKASSASLYLRALQETATIKLEFNEKTTVINQLRLMQGTNRPFRKVFKAALDGSRKDAEENPVEGLLFEDGGGITINHPSGSVEDYLPVLDFDPRVLGIEVWNHRRRFGRSRSFLHSYLLWDEILSTGRRCFGFFVKDHRRYGMGRNVLLLPHKEGASRHEKEHDALRAYRRGAFFGLLGALSVDGNGEIKPPYDYSQFRFKKIELECDQDGEPSGIKTSVCGNDRDTHIQIRFITESGIAKTSDHQKGQALFRFPKDTSGQITCKFVRIEAFAYPGTLNNGRQLTKEDITGMNVDQISLLHNCKTSNTAALCDYRFTKEEGTPVPVVDMIFSQPIIIRTPAS